MSLAVGAHETIRSLLSTSMTVPEQMEALIAWCKVQESDCEWSPFDTIDVASELPALEAWFDELLATSAPPEETAALWFGIFTDWEDGSGRCTLYVSGYRGFFSDALPGDWDAEDRWWPEGRYADSEALRQLYWWSTVEAASSSAEYVLCLGYASFVVHHLCSRPSAAGVGRAEGVAVAVGFDDGDLHFLGLLGDQGLGPIDEAEYYEPLPVFAPAFQFLELSSTGRAHASLTSEASDDGSVDVGFYQEGPVAEISWTIGNHWVVSQRVVTLLERHAPSAFDTAPARVPGHADGSFVCLSPAKRVDHQPLETWAEAHERPFGHAEAPGPLFGFTAGRSDLMYVNRDCEAALRAAEIEGLWFKEPYAPYVSSWEDENEEAWDDEDEEDEDEEEDDEEAWDDEDGEPEDLEDEGE